MNRLTESLDSITSETAEQYRKAENKFEFCCEFLKVETYAPYANAWVGSMEDRINELEKIT